MRRSLVGIGIHVYIRGGSSGGKGGRICGRAAPEGGVVVVLNMVGEDLRRANRFVGIRVSKVNVPLAVGVSVANHDAVSSGVSLVDIGLAGSSRRVRRSHSPAQGNKLVISRDWKGRSFRREVLG